VSADQSLISRAISILVELGFLKGTPVPNRFGQPVTD